MHRMITRISRTLSARRLTVSLALAGAGLCPLTAAGAAFTWNGNDAAYDTASQWTPTGPPDESAGDDVTINSGTVNYSGSASGDFAPNGTVTINGGTFQQAAGDGNFTKIGDGMGNTGTLIVNSGASYDAGGSTAFIVGNANGTGNVNVVGGSLAVDTNVEINTGSSFSLNGGTVTTNSGEFKPKDGNGGAVSAGTLNVNLISFDGNDATFDLSGGRINIANGTHFDGIFSAGSERYVNFTGGGGTLFLGNDATATNANALLSSDRVRASGLTDDSLFAVNEVPNGVELSLVPEPASLALMGIGGLLLVTRRRSGE